MSYNLTPGYLGMVLKGPANVIFFIIIYITFNPGQVSSVGVPKILKICSNYSISF